MTDDYALLYCDGEPGEHSKRVPTERGGGGSTAL